MKSSTCFYIIGLESNFRGAELVNQVRQMGVQYEVIKAVDGSLFNQETLEKVYSSKSSRRLVSADLTRGEVACALSHQLVYKSFLKSDFSLAVILEDDAHIVDDFQLLKVLRFLEHNEVLSRKSLGVHLNSSRLPVRLRRSYSDEEISSLIRLLRPPARTHGYIVNRHGASSLLLGESEKITTAADWPLAAQSMSWWTPNQPLVTISESKSTLDEERFANTQSMVRSKFPRAQRLITTILKVSGLGLIQKDLQGLNHWQIYLFWLPPKLHVFKLLSLPRKFEVG